MCLGQDFGPLFLYDPCISYSNYYLVWSLSTEHCLELFELPSFGALT
jgi:hypothetical protein